MARYIEAVKAAEILAERTKYSMADLVDWFCLIDSEDVQPVKHARWNELQFGVCFECSECGNMRNIPEPYCDQCGSKMDLR